MLGSGTFSSKQFLVLLSLAFGAILIFALAFVPSLPAQIQVAGELFVDLDASDPTAGGPLWHNGGTSGDFVKVGNPVLVTLEGAPAVSFNATEVLDSYQSPGAAPAGLVGLNPTRTIEAWVFNDDIPGEETILSWGKRGGSPDGSNMAFNYGNNAAFGAIGHWGSPDIGWGTVPEAGMWHHLVYTYDGTTTRLYSDGFETNSEILGPGAINTHAGTKITLAQQLQGDGVAFETGLRGILSIGKARIHDGVLSPEQVLQNYLAERNRFPLATTVPPAFLDPPAEDHHLKDFPVYTRKVRYQGFPVPDLSVIEPLPGGAIGILGNFSYTLPDPRPASFKVHLKATSSEGSAEASWTVTVLDGTTLQTAGELFVSLDAKNPTAGTPTWENLGTLDDFVELGDPVTITHGGNPAVKFNAGAALDAYQSLEDAPAGLVGPDPTRTIEAWVFNPAIADEETILAWGHRGGAPDGSNMAFNYGNNAAFGAIGHWGSPDIGWGASVPVANQWHHLVYTYDGTTTRVYADGALANSEFLGPGAIDTFFPSKITLAAQIEPDGIALNTGLRGTLSLGRVRIHDGVLDEAQILNNYNLEKNDFPNIAEAPSFLNAPAEDFIFKGNPTYVRYLKAAGYPVPALSVSAPIGATLDSATGKLSYNVPDPPPASFRVTVRAQNDVGSKLAIWTVTVKDPPAPGHIEKAGELFVDLDAHDPTAGAALWKNLGTIGDFLEVGDPQLETIDGAPGVTFNAVNPGESYQSPVDAPAGLVGEDPTRTIEAWVYNTNIPPEETIVAWGRRGGPAGTNMTFNFGSHELFGAIGHWGAPDIGWFPGGAGAPPSSQWTHVAYTFDGTTTRVYIDGAETNNEFLGFGVINTYPGKINLAQQTEPNGIDYNLGLQGSLTIGLLRIHDGVLQPEQIFHNFNEERDDFPLPAPPAPENLTAAPIHRYSFTADATDSVGGANGTLYGGVTFESGQAVLHNDGNQFSNASGVSPPAPPPGDYIDLPNGIISALGDEATIEAWFTWRGPANSSWHRVFDFGSANGGEDSSDTGFNTYNLYLTPRSFDNTLRFGYREGITTIERQVNAPPSPLDIEQHVAVVWDGANMQATLYVNGLRVEQNQTHFLLSDILDNNNWLGRSQWPDPMFAGGYNEFRIYDYALTPGQVIGNFQAGPDTLTSPEIRKKFRRGDLDNSGVVDISDPINGLHSLFLGDFDITCQDAADFDDSGEVDISDMINSLLWQFAAGPIAPPPGPFDCGVDLTVDKNPDGSPGDLGCGDYTPGIPCQ